MTRVRGYAAYFGIRNSHGEIALPGCFTDSCNAVAAGARLPFYAAHGWLDGWMMRNTGRAAVAVGAVDTLIQDTLGLYYEAEIIDNPADELAGAVRDSLALLGTSPASVGWSYDGAVLEEVQNAGQWTTLLHSVPLIEISMVAQGADPQAYVELVPKAPAPVPDAAPPTTPAAPADQPPPAAAGQENTP